MNLAARVEATARIAGNPGFDTWVVADATATFAKPDNGGVLRTAAEVHAISLANLEGEYARIATTEEVLARLGEIVPPTLSMEPNCS